MPADSPQAARVITHQLANTPAAILQTLWSLGAKVAICGKDQELWDIPEFHFLDPSECMAWSFTWGTTCGEPTAGARFHL